MPKPFQNLLARPALAGLLSALAVFLYIAIFTAIVNILRSFGISPPFALSILLFLSTLTFSVATMGALIFGIPAFLCLRSKYSLAIAHVAATLGWILVGIIIIISAISLGGGKANTFYAD